MDSIAWDVKCELEQKAFNSIEWIREWSPETTILSHVGPFNSIEWIRMKFGVGVWVGLLGAFNSIEWIHIFKTIVEARSLERFLSIPLNGFLQHQAPIPPLAGFLSIPLNGFKPEAHPKSTA